FYDESLREKSHKSIQNLTNLLYGTGGGGGKIKPTLEKKIVLCDFFLTFAKDKIFLNKIDLKLNMRNMETVYNEIVEYFKKSTEKDKKMDLLFLGQQIKSDVLASDYINQLQERIKGVLCIGENPCENKKNTSKENFKESLCESIH
ncbi:MAG: hypothetical protein VZQ98_18295, partial [Bacteroidales bacterium]|nr:hypothetical protein [Bacteroidales bacterium]